MEAGRRGVLVRTLEVFTPAARRQLYRLFVIVLITAVLEVAGIASLMPFLAVVSDPSIIDNQPLLAALWSLGEFTNTNQFLLVLGGTVFLLILATNGLTVASIYLLQHFAWNQNHDLSERLLARYLAQPWSFFVSRNTSELGSKILTDVQSFLVGYVYPLLIAITQGIAAIGILGLLVAVDPVIAGVVTLVLGGAYLLIYRTIRSRLIVYGERRKGANEARFRTASEALSGIKEIKVAGLEPTFSGRYSAPSDDFRRAQTFQAVLAVVPRNAVEVVAFGTVLIILLYELALRGEVSSVVPVVGVYAFAGYRLLPKAQQIYAAVTSVRFHQYLLDTLHWELRGLHDSEEGAPADPPPLTRAIELRHAMFGYEGSSRPALNDVSLTVPCRGSVAFVGATGSGKSTCMDVLLGLLPLDSGEIVIDGRVLEPAEVLGWRRRCGYVPQQIFLTDDTVAANIAFGVSPRERELDALERAARLASIHDFISRELPLGYDTAIGEGGVRLSGGQRQRIGLARALFRDPDVLFLDEATSALDHVTELAVMDGIRRLSGKKTLIIVAHRLSTVRHCDVIYLFDRGRIVSSGSYDELMSTSVAFRRLADAPDDTAHQGLGHAES